MHDLPWDSDASQKLMSQVSSRAVWATRIVIVLLAIIAVETFIFHAKALLLKYPPVWPDEALFADTSIHLLRHGSLATDLLSGVIPGIERHAYWMPPAYFVFLAAVFRISQPGVLPMRLASLAAALAVMSLIYTLALRSGLGRWLSLLPVALLAVDVVFLRSSLVGRMDMLTLALILAALLLVIGTARAPAPTAARSFWAGVCSALAVLTHPVGVVAPVALVSARVLLPQRHRIRSLISLLLGISLPLLLWAVYILWDPGDFAAQWAGQLVRKETRRALTANPLWDSLRLNISQYGLPETLVLLLWICGLAGICVAALRRRELLVLPACQIALLAVVIWSDELWYPVYLLPLTALGVAHLISLTGERGSWVRIPASLALLLCLWFARSSLDRISAINEAQNTLNWKSTDYSGWCEAVSKELPPRSTVVLAAIPDPYFGLFSRTDLVLREFVPEAIPVDPEAYRRFLSSADYIIAGREAPTPAIREFVSSRGQLLTTIGEPRGEGYYARIYRIKP